MSRQPSENEEVGEPGTLVWFPERTWNGRTYVPVTAPTSEGFELFGYVSYTREHEGAEATDFEAKADYTGDYVEVRLYAKRSAELARESLYEDE